MTALQLIADVLESALRIVRRERRRTTENDHANASKLPNPPASRLGERITLTRLLGRACTLRFARMPRALVSPVHRYLTRL